jgi:hypothetical protein
MKTLFGINDHTSSPDYEINTYHSKFTDFISSLGYEVKRRADFSSAVYINDIVFSLVVNNCTRYAKSAFSRQWNKRKPENRFAEVRTTNHSKLVLKVQINKEYDADKLRAKIDAAIKAEKDHDIAIEKLKLDLINNTNKIGRHYLSNNSIKDAVKYISINQGVLFFSFTANGSLSISSAGEFIIANMGVPKMNSVADVMALADNLATQANELNRIVGEIMNIKPLDNYLVEWAKSADNQSFYSNTMSTDWK